MRDFLVLDISGSRLRTRKGPALATVPRGSRPARLRERRRLVLVVLPARLPAGRAADWPICYQLHRISERLANSPRYPCAKRVTWTRRYKMIRGRKALILIALGGMTHGGAIGSFCASKNPLTHWRRGLIFGCGGWI